MMRLPKRYTVMICALAMVLMPAASAAAKPQGGTVKVGVASRSVLPTVNGSTSYLDGKVPPATDANSLGAFVPHFDQGRVGVSNGGDRAFWVHDDVRVRAMAIDDPRSHRIVVVVSTDLYMMFRPDGDQVRR